MNLVFEGLVRSTADGKSIEPCLATSWDISDDGLVYTFHLREDVKFSDGTPVTAEDWEYSLERSLELGAWNSLISSIDDVKAVDEKTIDIVLKNPSGSLLASLAAFFCAVVPKDYYSSTDDDTLASNPIGTGPFYLESWVPQESMCFKKNPNYWDAEHPFADEIDFLVVPDDNTRIMQLQAGQVDIATGINAQIAILVAIGVNSDGNREVIGATEGGREDKESWIRFLRSLKDRGLHGTRLIVGARCVVFEFYATIILTLCCTTKYTFSVAPCMATVPETYISFSCTKFRYRKIAI